MKFGILKISNMNVLLIAIGGGILYFLYKMSQPQPTNPFAHPPAVYNITLKPVNPPHTPDRRWTPLRVG